MDRKDCSVWIKKKLFFSHFMHWNTLIGWYHWFKHFSNMLSRLNIYYPKVCELLLRDVDFCDKQTFDVWEQIIIIQVHICRIRLIGNNLENEIVDFSHVALILCADEMVDQHNVFFHYFPSIYIVSGVSENTKLSELYVILWNTSLTITAIMFLWKFNEIRHR